MSNSHCFDDVYKKLHLQPLFNAGLSENLHDMVRQNMSDNPRVVNGKLARHYAQFHKMRQ